MRKLLLIGSMLYALTSNAQTDQEKRGYIGITIGPAFPKADLKAKIDNGTGLNLNLINFGYTIRKKWGLSASWLGGAHLSKSMQTDAITAYGALLAGPSYSRMISDRSYLRLKGMIGFVHSLFEYKTTDFTVTTQSLSVGYSLGAVYQYNFSKNLCLLLNSEYLTARSSIFDTHGKIAAININAGVGFRLR